MRKLQSADYVFIIGLIVLVFIAGSVIYLVFSTDPVSTRRNPNKRFNNGSNNELTSNPADENNPDFIKPEPQKTPDPDVVRPKPEYNTDIVWPNYEKWEAPKELAVNQPIRIEGVVLDSKGVPIEDVEIGYTPVDISSGNLIALSIKPYNSKEKPALAEETDLSNFGVPDSLSTALKTKTNAEGKFYLPYSSQYFVIKMKKQFYYENSQVCGYTGEEIELKMDKWGVIVGRVLDSAKYPMTNFRVEIFKVDEKKRVGKSDILPSGHEEDGVTYFRYKYYVGNKLFGCYLGEGVYDVTVSVDTFISYRTKYNITKNMELNKIFTVIKQTIIKGVVVPESNPTMFISNASVTLLEKVASGTESIGSRKTNKNGEFFFSKLHGGTYTLQVEHAKYGKTEVDVYVSEGQIKEEVVTLAVGNYLEGKVVNEDKKAVPYANVMIEAYPPKTSVAMRQKDSITDQDGRFLISLIEPGTYRVVVRTAESYLRYEQIFTVTEGKNSLSITLLFGVKVVLHITSDDEIPQSIYVTLDRDLAKSEMPYEELLQGDEKTWSPARKFYGAAVQQQQDPMHYDATFQGVYPGHYFINVNHNDVLEKSEPFEVTGDKREIHHDIVISSGLKITGKVVDPTNKPLHRASISISREGKNERWISTDEEGRFSIRGLLPETYIFIAEFRGFKTYEMKYNLKQSLTDQVIKLEMGDSLTGIVLDPDGEPKAGVGIQLWAPPRGSYEGFPFAKTDEEGKFTFTGLKSGTFKVEVYESGFIVEKDLTVQVPGDVTIQLKKGLSISGLIKNNRGELVSDASVIVFEADPADPDSNKPMMGKPPKGQGFTRADGKFNIQGLRPGAYHIIAMHRDYPEYKHTIQINSNTQHNIIFDEGLSCIGTIQYTSGKIPQGAFITLSLKGSDEFGKSGNVNSQTGSFKVDAVAKGSYVLKVIQQPNRMIVYETDVMIPQSQPLNLSIPEVNKFKISGTVVDKSGQPIPFAYLKVTKAGDTYYRGTEKCNSAGAFTLKKIAPGEYTFVAMTKGNDILTPTFKVSVSNSDVTNVVFKANDVVEGVRIMGVFPGGKGEKAGVQKGDIITEYNGSPVSTSRALSRASMKAIGQGQVSIKINRNGKILTLTIEPGLMELDYN